MKNALNCFILIAMLAASSTVAADSITANEAMPGCRALVNEDFSGPLSGFCLGVIQGIEVANIISLGTGGEGICYPTGVTREQFARIILKSAEDNPDMTHVDFKKFAYASLLHAFPCEAPE